MKTYILSTILFISLLIFPINQTIAECNNGGPGSSSCEDSGTISMGWWIFSYEVSYSNSVSCGAGYYACCNMESATCIPDVCTVSSE